MSEEYKPQEEVIDFGIEVLQSFQTEGRLADQLSTLSAGTVDNLEQAVAEMRSGETKFGRAIYRVFEHAYNLQRI